jgi:leucyl aminopeptidase
MAHAPKINFSAFSEPKRGTLAVLCGDGLAFGSATRRVLGKANSLIERAAKAERFTGKKGSTLSLTVPAGLNVSRLVMIGTGKPSERDEQDALKIGGQVLAQIAKSETDAAVFAEWPNGAMKSFEAADLAMGLSLRAYEFDRYKTKRKEEDKRAPLSVSIGVADVADAKRAYSTSAAIADGVVVARDLVNEPANVLYPEEFARRAAQLRKLGVKVEILDVKAMQKLGMGALLGVGQGSVRESRLVVMQWNGGRASDKPVAFIGKGVCFDTGGISIKPAASMEDMKGDMAGAACVTGLMHALAGRKAKVNAVGLIGLVENMPDGNAQRPGDIVKSMSGQTIEIINTDAEGRLVLADVLWYAATRFKPKFMVNLATLTGAIIVALGQEHAGMFSNNDKLAERLDRAGKNTGETVWRMPLGAAYDKMIDSKFADVKNTGGSRWGGAITAAQFLQRFVKDETPWAHLDIAGTGMDSRPTDINRSWGSGWGVRLLDRLVRDHYES